MPGSSKPWAPLAKLFAVERGRRRSRSIGLEIERVGVWEQSGTALQYRSKDGRLGAGELLRKLSKQVGGKLTFNRCEEPLGLTLPNGKVTLEPGSQLEFATKPLRNIAALKNTVENFERQVDRLTFPLGISWLTLGVNPINQVSEIDVIPLPRYKIMTDYLGKSGTLGTAMMRLSASVQVNIDYFSEEEAIDMLRVAFHLTPLSYALFSNSPFFGGNPAGMLSFRNWIWQHTDPDRTGILEEVFRPGYSLLDYAEHLWKYPLMYYESSPGNFRMAKGGLSRLSTGSKRNYMHAVRELFTEARLKPGYLEIRSLDLLPPSVRWGAVAFWIGVLDDAEVRGKILKIFENETPESRSKAQHRAITEGLSGKFADLARSILPLVRESLRKRGQQEESYLEPLDKMIARRKNLAQSLLERYQNGEDHDRSLSCRSMSLLCQSEAVS